MTTLHFELYDPTHYLKNPWAFGVNVSHASLLARKEVQRQLLLGRDELGFRHVRFHGVFDDAMKVLQADGAFDFTHLEPSLDWLMESGFSPFIGLSGIPSALAAGKADLASTIGDRLGGMLSLSEELSLRVPTDVRRWMDFVAAAANRRSAGPPADIEKWVDMVRALAAFVDGRYGCDAQEWHFEVWNQPDKPSHWSGGQADYFRLYDLSARAIKSVNAQFKVGGPAAADFEWCRAFVDHVAKPSEDFGLEMQRCHFVSMTALSTGHDAPGSDGRVEQFAALRQKLTTDLGDSATLLLSSWGVGADGSATADTCAAGAVTLAAIAPLADIVDGALYTSISDVDAEVELAPFHGGDGLFTVNDIRKASFNVLRLLNEHIGYKLQWRWIEPTAGLMAMVTKDYHNLVRIVASFDAPAGSPPAKFTIEGLPEHVKWGQVQVIRPGAGSPLETWLEAGRSPFVNRHLLDDLDAGSQPAMTEVNFREYPPRLEPGMTLQLTIPIPDNVGTMD